MPAEAESDRLEINPCGHGQTMCGCGGCDPGAIDFVIDDNGTRRPFDSTRDLAARPGATPQISRPSGLGEQEEGETSGQKLGVHSVRARQDPEGFGDRGVHGGPGILAGPGSGPTGRRPAGTDGRRGLSESTPTGDMPVGVERPTRPAITRPEGGSDTTHP